VRGGGAPCVRGRLGAACAPDAPNLQASSVVGLHSDPEHQRIVGGVWYACSTQVFAWCAFTPSRYVVACVAASCRPRTQGWRPAPRVGGSVHIVCEATWVLSRCLAEDHSLMFRAPSLVVHQVYHPHPLAQARSSSPTPSSAFRPVSVFLTRVFS